MGGRRGKRRAKGQRIGRKGEARFVDWATDRHLVANRCDDDFGLDFFCQHMAPIGNGVEEASGRVAATQVRSGDGPTVRFSPEDAENLIRLKMPFFIAAVRGRQIYYRFLDQVLLRELVAHLASHPRGSLRLPIDTFRAGRKRAFLADFERFTRPSTQQRLEILKHDLKVQALIRGARVVVSATSGSGTAMVRVPWAFDLVDPGSARRETIAELLVRGEIPPDLPFRPEIETVAGQLSELNEGPILLTAAVERRDRLAIQHGTSVAEVDAAIRIAADLIAFEHPAGLLLVFTGSRPRGDQQVHEFYWDFVRGVHTCSLEDAEVREFLRLLEPDAVLGLGGDPSMPIAWWGSLDRVGGLVALVERVYRVLGLELGTTYLADLKRKEFVETVSVASAIAVDGAVQAVAPGYVLGPMAEREVDEGTWERCSIRVPVVLTLASRGIALWVEGDGVACRDPETGSICGFRMVRQTAWEPELFDHPFEGVTSPQVWVHDEWPPFPCSPSTGLGLKTISYDGRRLPLAGEIRPLREGNPSSSPPQPGG